MVSGKKLVITKSEFKWEKAPPSDLDRLAKNLQSRARQDDELRVTIGDCRSHTESVLKSQQNTCLFSGGNDKYCWNEPRDVATFLRLQWSHMVPKAHAPKASLENFVLLCARCNNQIQSSRRLSQLIDELEHKINVLKSIASG